MILYTIKRLGYIVLTLILVSLIIFAATHLLPGSAANLILGTQATEEKIENTKRRLGLDRPLHIQYIDWFEDVVTGDWGNSLVMSRPILPIIKVRLRNSAMLAVFALISVILIGIPLGVLSAIKNGSRFDALILTGAYMGISLPEFVTGTLLILIFSGLLSLLPSGGYTPFGENPINWVRHMILPTATLTILLLAHVIRQTRSSMINVLNSDYIRTARLKGLEEKKVIVRHALKNGLLPTVTVIAMDLGYLMGSIVVVEEVFAYPGLGRTIVFAITNRDVPLLQIAILIVAATYTFANLAADLIYAYLDPRISYG